MERSKIKPFVNPKKGEVKNQLEETGASKAKFTDILLECKKQPLKARDKTH
jgi:hypothetical protein